MKSSEGPDLKHKEHDTQKWENLTRFLSHLHSLKWKKLGRSYFTPLNSRCHHHHPSQMVAEAVKGPHFISAEGILHTRKRGKERKSCNASSFPQAHHSCATRFHFLAILFIVIFLVPSHLILSVALLSFVSISFPSSKGFLGCLPSPSDPITASFFFIRLHCRFVCDLNHLLILKRLFNFIPEMSLLLQVVNLNRAKGMR